MFRSSAAKAQAGGGQGRGLGRRAFLGIPALLLLAGGGRPAEAENFTDWLAAVRRQARADGVAQGTIDAAFARLQPMPDVLDKERNQPEFTLTLNQYLAKVVTDRRVALGRQMLEEHRPLLGKVQAKFGVQARFIVALWGVESDFGRQTGGYPVIGALATLAYGSQRNAMFHRELIDALHVLDQGNIELGLMTGSWAGAMGQCQFMPSSFRRFAVDFDGDGRRDIWTSEADVFASIANYLANYRWQAEQGWGREVRLPARFDARLTGLKASRPLAEWRRLGLRAADGSPLPGGGLQAALVIPDGPKGRAFLAYANFEIIMTWNRSTFFATSVGLLADRLAGA
jgi:membrane-bound lytic murein transglycosylase B